MAPEQKKTVEAPINFSLNPRKRARQESALERQAERATRTPQQQLRELDRVLGAGQGAKKERAKLAALIEAQAEKPATAEPAKKKGKGKKGKKAA